MTANSTIIIDLGYAVWRPIMTVIDPVARMREFSEKHPEFRGYQWRATPIDNEFWRVEMKEPEGVHR